MASQDLKLEIRGLVSSPNPFGAAPAGSFLVADNVVSRDAGILESRRGFAQHSLLPGGQRVTSFQSHLVAQANDTMNYYDGSWHALAGTFAAPDASTPMRFLQAAKSLLFTSDTGVKVMDAFNAAPKAAGVPRAFPITNTNVTLDRTSLGAWLPDAAKVNYWVVYGYYDANKSIILGTPSDAVTVYNSSGGTAAPTLTIPFAPRLDLYTDSFIQIYRSVAVTGGAEPLAEGFFVTEIPTTDARSIINTITFVDAVNVGNLGEALYINATQQGPGETNDPPPAAKDLCLFKNTTIYGNTFSLPRLLTRLASIGGLSGMIIGDTVAVAGATFTAAVAENTASQQFKWYPASAGSGNLRIACTLASLARCVAFVNQSPYAYYIDSGATPDSANAPATAGEFLWEGLATSDNNFTVSFGSTIYNVATGSMTRVGSKVTVTQVGHPFTGGSLVTVTGSDPNFPSGTFVVNGVTGTEWKYDQVGPHTVSSASPYTAQHARPELAWQSIGTPQGQFTSSKDPAPAGLAYSKVNQPNAVPLENGDDVGDPSAAVLRIIALRDSVLIFKEDGVYRLTGNSPDDFTIAPYDLTILLACPETAVALSDAVIGLTNQGMKVVSESAGAQPISRQIDEDLLQLLATSPDIFSGSFGISYQSENQYLTWLPSFTAEGGFPYTFPITFDADSTSGLPFIFNAYTNTWMRWTTQAVHGLVDPVTDKLVLIDGGQVLIERKDYADTDYQDIGGSANITSVVDSTHVAMAGPGVGDLITQSSNSARVLSVDSGILTLDTAGSWSVASADYATAIDCRVQWLPAAGENPGTVKQFQEMSLNFRLAQFAWIHVGFTTDVSQTLEQSLRYGRPAQPDNVNVRTLMPVNMARAVMINPLVEHQQALCNFQLQSASLIYRQVSTRTPSKGAP